MARKISPAGDVTSQDNPNLNFWNQVRKTPTKWQKKYEKDGEERTKIHPQWQVQRATELWGPYGKTWGFSHISYEIIKTAATDRSGTPYEASSVIINAIFYYPDEKTEEIVSFPIVNDGPFVPGQDSIKKVITNTRSKALSWLGFSADIFLDEQIDDMAETITQPTEGDVKVFNELSRKIDSAQDESALNWVRAKIGEMVQGGSLDKEASNTLLEQCDAQGMFLSVGN